MIVKKLQLRDYRNYQGDNIVNFDNGINILYGDNAQGKTNLVEAIYFSSIGKSFKPATKEKDLINFNSESSQIKLDVEKNIGTIQLEINLFNTQKKQIKVNGGNISKICDLLGNLVTVFFSPNDLKLVKETPEDRRKFLDIAISQLSKKYFYLLCKYQEILLNRNNLLKSGKNINDLKKEIDVWDIYLSQTAKSIIEQRSKFVELLSTHANKIHKYLTDEKENLVIKYQYGDFGEDIESGMIEKLKNNLGKDLQFGYTTIGPHRDDLKLLVNDKDVKVYGSQGQQRTVALTLKLAEKEILSTKLDEYPIMILDDVFSELDDKRKQKLLNLLSNKGQTFITTTTEKDLINESIGLKIKIDNGKINLRR